MPPPLVPPPPVLVLLLCKAAFAFIAAFTPPVMPPLPLSLRTPPLWKLSESYRRPSQGDRAESNQLSALRDGQSPCRHALSEHALFRTQVVMLPPTSKFPAGGCGLGWRAPPAEGCEDNTDTVTKTTDSPAARHVSRPVSSPRQPRGTLPGPCGALLYGPVYPLSSSCHLTLNPPRSLER